MVFCLADGGVVIIFRKIERLDIFDVESEIFKHPSQAWHFRDRVVDNDHREIEIHAILGSDPIVDPVIGGDETLGTAFDHGEDIGDCPGTDGQTRADLLRITSYCSRILSVRL